MCSLHFLESSRRTVVTALRWHPASTTMDLQLSAPSDHWNGQSSLAVSVMGRRDSSFLYFSKLHRLTLPLLPCSSETSHLPSSPHSPVSQTSRSFLPLANQIQLDDQRPSLPQLFGWIGVTKRGGSCRGHLPFCGDTPPFPTSHLVWKNSLEGSVTRSTSCVC